MGPKHSAHAGPEAAPVGPWGCRGGGPPGGPPLGCLGPGVDSESLVSEEEEEDEELDDESESEDEEVSVNVEGPEFAEIKTWKI